MVIIGDVHGNFDTLQALLAGIPEGEKGHVCFVGDLIDRGPKSREVVEFVKAGVEAGVFSCVKGNHEIMMIEEGENPRFSGIWISNGGLECLNSYNDTVRDNDLEGYSLPYRKMNDKLLKDHIEWMKNLPLFVEFPDLKNADGRHLVVSHSSISRVWKWSEERRKTQAQLFQDTIVWNRQPPIDVKEIYNVIGHTPLENGPRITKCYANVDTGCFYKHAGYGVLTALHWPSMKVYQQANIDQPRGGL